MPKGLQGFQKGDLNPTKKPGRIEEIRKEQTGRKHSQETTKKRLESRKWYRHSEETKKKIGKSNSISQKGKFGELSSNWRGGVTKLQMLIRGKSEYTKWRLDVFARDGFVCVWCNDSRGGNLQADHINPLSAIIHNENINTIQQAMNCEKIWDMENGRTLCALCHSKTDTFGVKALRKFVGHKDKKL